MKFIKIPQDSILCPECGYAMGGEFDRETKLVTVWCGTGRCPRVGDRYIVPIETVELERAP